MPTFTVARQYLVPVFQTITLEAADAATACHFVTDDDAYPGDTAYAGTALPVPAIVGESRRRIASLPMTSSDGLFASATACMTPHRRCSTSWCCPNRLPSPIPGKPPSIPPAPRSATSSRRANSITTPWRRRGSSNGRLTATMANDRSRGHIAASRHRQRRYAQLGSVSTATSGFMPSRRKIADAH